jgi:Tfp pilus assembly protein PilN
VIRTNLSTRPFYNVRAVRAAIAGLALLVLAITAFNVAQIVRLTASQRTLGSQAADAERDAARLRKEAAQILSQIDPKELEVVATAAQEANGIIDQRTFSWTNLFTHFEATLPADVRITSVTPQPNDNVVRIGVQARSVEDLDAFIGGLEMTGAFHDVLPTTEVAMEDNLIEAMLVASYEDSSPPAETQR